MRRGDEAMGEESTLTPVSGGRQWVLPSVRFKAIQGD